jgi:tRNA (cmo5U34)-methyltransferase
MTDKALETFASQAAGYDAQRRRLIPGYDSFYGAVLEALAELDPPAQRVLELGAGTGLLSAMVADAEPQAELVLLDGATPMLDRARSRLGERASYRSADLRDPLPEGEFCAVVSALAIHHLDDEAKRDLFARVHAALRPGGAFVNAELVLAPTPRLDQHDVAWHGREATALGASDDEWTQSVERMAFDRLATMEAQLQWLREAGFNAVDCRFKIRRFAVLYAQR